MPWAGLWLRVRHNSPKKIVKAAAGRGHQQGHNSIKDSATGIQRWASDQMADQQEQANLARDMSTAFNDLNAMLNAAHKASQGQPHRLFDDYNVFGHGFRGYRWLTALSGPNEGTAGVAPQVFVDWEMLALGRGRGQANEAAGDDINNVGIGRGRGAPTAANQGQAGRRLRSPDWKCLRLAPLSKNFYEEHKKTAIRSPAEVDAFREANQITTAGWDVPKPVLNVDEAGFPEDLMKGLQAVKYSSISSLQSQCWPVALSGRDLLAVVHAESQGKALGYLLPAIVHIKHQRPLQKHEGPIALVLAATRKSAQDTEQTMREFEKCTSLRAICVSSGLPRDPQLKLLEEGAEIWVATPGRLVALMEDSQVSLSRCSYLVIDGADRMVNMGLEGQLRTIAKNIRPDRQTLMWIASRSMDLEHIAEELLINHVTVTIGESKACQKQRVDHIVLVCEEEKKEDALISLFQDILCGEGDKVVVFVEMRQTVDDLVVKMQKRGWRAVGIHQKKQEKERNWALESFRLRSASVLVTTDVVAGGLNEDSVRFVVNFDRPARPEGYYRRVKHAVRVDGSGKAYSFLAPSDSSYAREMTSIFREAKQEIPREVLNIAKGRALLSWSPAQGGRQ